MPPATVRSTACAISVCFAIEFAVVSRRRRRNKRERLGICLHHALERRGDRRIGCEPRHRGRTCVLRCAITRPHRHPCPFNARSLPPLPRATKTSVESAGVRCHRDPDSIEHHVVLSALSWEACALGAISQPARYERMLRCGRTMLLESHNACNGGFVYLRSHVSAISAADCSRLPGPEAVSVLVADPRACAAFRSRRARLSSAMAVAS